MNKLIEKAYIFAENAHKDDKRKNGTPYFEHPALVASLLNLNKASDELIAAGYLHDVVEDTSYTIEDIRNNFGDKIYYLVLSNTEDKSKTWEERKIHTIQTLIFRPLEERMLLVADKFANLLELQKQLNEKPENEVWSLFNRGKKEQQWYFTSIALSMNINLKDDEPKLFDDYRKLVLDVFGPSLLK